MTRRVHTAHLADRLTDRDYAILGTVHTHRVLTTLQAGALFFTGPTARNARRRLLALHRYGLLDTFRPTTPGPGTRPVHWTLAPTGARVLAHHRGLGLDELGYRHDTAAGIAHSAKLDHTTGLVQTFTAFTLAARATPGAHLAVWWGEVQSAAEWGGYVRPDAYLRWIEEEARVDAFLEYDTGTEALTRVARKLPGYARLAAASRMPSPILFAVPGTARETNLAAALAPHATPATPIRLTTHALLAVPGPAAAIWRAPDSDHRHRLADPTP
ncbi:hypothetical protein HDA32_005595 [Spinactinospora alkalitolerans]|uniref:Replication-relaxation n=1 Tax=Spinactinospora alkalitolerans TaxID=687207 RepID=A0A852U4M3_9ACTN|nr:replication-relaxation family protein [Spinactinospora alkalitolerans]NYE50475.1 hypothetical protein [Spinactinospora alkalitolerans]